MGNWWNSEVLPRLRAAGAWLRRYWVAIMACSAMIVALAAVVLGFVLADRDGDKLTRAEAVKVFDRNADGKLTRADRPRDGQDGFDGADGVCDLDTIFDSTRFCKEVDYCHMDIDHKPAKPIKKKVVKKRRRASKVRKRAPRPYAAKMVTEARTPTGGTHHVVEKLQVPPTIRFRFETETVVVQ